MQESPSEWEAGPRNPWAAKVVAAPNQSWPIIVEQKLANSGITVSLMDTVVEGQSFDG